MKVLGKGAAAASAVVVGVLVGAEAAAAKTLGEVTRDARAEWLVIAGSIAVIIIGIAAVKLAGAHRKPGEMVGIIAIVVVVVSMLVSSPLWIDMIRDSGNKIL